MYVMVASCGMLFRDSTLYVLVQTLQNGGITLQLPRAVLSETAVGLESLAENSIEKAANIKPVSVHQVKSSISRVDHHSSSVYSNASEFLEVLFLCILPSHWHLSEQDKNKGVRLLRVDELSQMPRSSLTAVEDTWELLRKKCRFDSTIFDFLPAEFSLGELQKLFESITGKPVDVRNFRKKIESLEILTLSQTKSRGMAYRPPRLFVFNKNKYQERIQQDGEVRFF
jgi:ADP-ribose pyrophosphatase YjhB (NUDIX family)